MTETNMTIYDELVAPCVKMIEECNLSGARVLYRSKVQELQAQYL